MWVLGPELDPLREQPVLLTPEPTLQPNILNLIITFPMRLRKHALPPIPHSYSILAYTSHGVQFFIWRASKLTSPSPTLASKTSSLSTSWFAVHRYPSPTPPCPWITVFCSLQGASTPLITLSEREYMAGRDLTNQTHCTPQSQDQSRRRQDPFLSLFC